MKKLALLTVLIGLFFGCSKNPVGPMTNTHVGCTEDSIIKQNGMPHQSLTNNASEFKAPPRFFISKTLSSNLLVKELYYKVNDGEKIFWLTNKESGWVVFADAIVPKNWQY